jgi:ribosomal protein S12 methylthiotransferase
MNVLSAVATETISLNGISIGVVSLGCAKNRIDTETMLASLVREGCIIVNNPSDADVIIVNTCGFIASAKEESVDAILEMAEYKKNGKCRALIAAGCLVQRYADELKKEIPEVDAFVGVTEYPRLASIVQSVLVGSGTEGQIIVRSTSHCADIFEGKRILTTQSHTAYVRISDGCDNRCAYCAIPLIRGSYRSRGYDVVIEEARDLVSHGVKEIVYIAQDTTRFGEDTEGKRLLPKLLRETALIDGIEWVRVLYTYPGRVTDELLETIAHTPKICPYLDVPLQHIDERILSLMNRRQLGETAASIKKMLLLARSMGITLRTTLIVGFPGEGDDEFKRLLDFVEEIEFDRLGAFTYSREEDTPAFDMQGQVPEDVAADRLKKLMSLQQKISLRRNTLRIGYYEHVLLEREAQDGIYIGRSMRESPEEDGIIRVHTTNRPKVGSIVDVKINKALPYDLEGVQYE